MQYWYPTQQRVAAIAAELEQLRKIAADQARGAGDFLASISHALVAARKVSGFPEHQTGHWVWVASQFRLLAGSKDEPALAAGAALNFLIRRLNAPFKDADIQDLNWVLHATLSTFGRTSKPEAFSSCLDADELFAIEGRLAQMESTVEFNADDIRSRVQKQLNELNEFSTHRQFSDIKTKVETLFKATEKSGQEGRVARGALLYLADEEDVVSDRLGLLGLLDDLYVIEWAYAVVTQETRCLPILEEFLERWPFIADLAIVGDPPLQLDKYGQYVACACLSGLFDIQESSLLILRETAGFGAISALMAAIQCVKLNEKDLEQDIGTWPVGQQVILADGTEHFRAVFKGLHDIGGKPKIWLAVAKDGKITVDPNVAPYLARTSETDKPLSPGTRILSWLKERHLDPLVGLTGTSRRRLQSQECVLLVGPRHKLDSYFMRLRPFGMSAASLVGAKYVTSDQNARDIDGEPSDLPFIYACSDPDVAADLIRNPPEHVAGWKVIVDGAKTGSVLHASLQSSGGLTDVRLCVLGELHEREAARDLVRAGLPVWYLEPHDVQAPSPSRTEIEAKDDDLTRSVRRQGGYWFQSVDVKTVHNDFLESAASCLRERATADDGSPQARSLDMALSAFLRKAISMPLRDGVTEQYLNDSARRLASYASTLRRYDPRADKIFDLFREHTDTLPRFDRQSALVALGEMFPRSSTVAVVCRSVRAADICKVVALTVPTLNRMTWITIEGLRRSAPFDLLIVPGWLDRHSMREIANNGYAEDVELILFPFEKRWFDATRDANEKWEKRLQAATVHTLKTLPAYAALNGGRGTLWRKQVEERLTTNVLEEVHEVEIDGSDVPEFEKLEERAIATLTQGSFLGRIGHETARAQLVLFEDGGAYAFLPPEGKVIVLSSGDVELDEGRLLRAGAESMLFRSIATLKPGMVLAFSQGGDRDLIDARADQFIQHADAVRATAAMWKVALRRRINPTWEDYVAFADRMAAAGQRRDPATIRAWITHTNSVAPRNFRAVIPLLATLTGDQELQAQTVSVCQAVDLIYRARARAAEAIVRELFSGKIDLTSQELRFDLNGMPITYSLHRVGRVAGIQDVPIELIGKVRTFDQYETPPPLVHHSASVQ